MPQLSFERTLTPQTLSLRLTHDPINPELGFTVSATIQGADHNVIGRGSVALVGLEVDCMDTVVQRVVEVFMWGNAPQLHHIMRQARRTATAHAERHRTAPDQEPVAGER